MLSRACRAQPDMLTPPCVATSCPAAVGVPAKVIKRLDEFEEPVKEMDQVSGFILDYGE